jgi:NADPH:quinone reductase-like Zn-dependent oxidoreductase
MAQTMKAARIHEYGGPEVFRYEDAPKPEARTGEVLVRVHAAGINPVDWKTRMGRGMTGGDTSRLPLIVGWDISGVVESVGPEANKFKSGDEVFGMVRFPEIGSAYAEYVAAPETNFALKPNDVTHVEAAAVPLVALTAWQAFEAGGLSEGQRVLIQGAAGGVGHIAVQIAKAKGAYVIGTGSPTNHDYIRSLGADDAVDYDAAIEPVDMILNAAGMQTLDRSLTLLKPGGALISISGGPNKDKAQELQVKAESILVHTDEVQMHQVAQLMAGQLKATIAEVYPLAEAGAAQHSGETRAVRRGKIVLEVG